MQSRVEGNQGLDGGGVGLNLGAAAWLSNSLVQANRATRSGGGVLSAGSSHLYASHVSFVKNVAAVDGGVSLAQACRRFNCTV